MRIVLTNPSKHNADVFESPTSSGVYSLPTSQLERFHFASYNLTISIKSYKDAPKKNKCFPEVLIRVFCCARIHFSLFPLFRYQFSIIREHSQIRPVTQFPISSVYDLKMSQKPSFIEVFGKCIILNFKRCVKH